MAVRLEKVRLELEDAFSAQALGAAAAARTLGTSLDRSGRDGDSFARNIDQSSSSIDRLSGRLGLAARAVAAFGPGLVPITTAVTPALAGLVTQMGFAAAGAGVLVTAFQGVGDALKAAREYELEPSAESLAKLNEALRNLSPAAQAAVMRMRELAPVLQDIKFATQDGGLPGFIEGLDSFERLAPRIESIFATIADAAGDLFADGMESLASDEWAPFFEFLEAEARPALLTFGQTVGNVSKGIAELVMAMDPLSDDFTSGLLAASERFEAWAENLTQTEGYAEFIDYVRETGPQVMETLGSLANALLQIGEAAAPLGGPVLKVLEAFADVIAGIADSPLGTPILTYVSALSALRLAAGATTASLRLMNIEMAKGAGAAGIRGLVAPGGAIGKLSAVKTGAMVAGGAAAIGAGALAMEKGLIGMNTAMGASIGMLAGPWGAAIGGGVGLMMDFADRSSEATQELVAWAGALEASAASGALVGDALDEAVARYSDERAAFLADRERLVGGKSLEAVGTTWADIFGKSDLTETEESLVRASAAIREGRRAQLAAKIAADSNAQSQGYLNAEMMEQAEAVRAAADAWLDSANAQSGFEGAMNNLKDAIGEGSGAMKVNGDVVRGATDEQLRAYDALMATAAAWRELDPIERKARGGMARMRESFIGAAISMGASKEAAERLADRLLKIPPNVTTNVEVKGAIEGARSVQELINTMARLKDKSVWIRTYHQTFTGQGADGSTYNGTSGAPSNGAEFVNGQRRWSGGPVFGPGTDTSDSIPAMLSNGEYVIRAAAVRRYGMGFFDRANAMHLASGGPVSGRGDSDATRENTKAVKELTAEQKEERRERRKERARLRAELERLRGRSSDLRGAVSGSLRDDLFGTPEGGVWSQANAQGVNGILKNDIADARQIIAATKTLKNKGLNGGALDALLASGDAATIQAYSRMDKNQLAKYENLYRTRERLSGRAGKAAGEAAYGPAINRIERRLKAIERHTKDGPKKTGEEVGRNVNRAARSGARSAR